MVGIFIKAVYFKDSFKKYAFKISMEMAGLRKIPIWLFSPL